MTLSQLSYIVAVANHRNFGAAADASHVTQPTLSMQIQKLEEELGVVLFDRSAQPIRLTPIGEQIIAQSRLVLAEAQKIHSLTQAEKSDVRGAISIGVIPTLAPYVLPLFIKSFSEHFPHAQITIEELQTQQIIERMKADSLDVGLLVTPLHQTHLVEHVLFYEPFQLYVSPSHPLYGEKKINEGDLSSKDVWLLSEGHCFRDQAIALCGDNKKRASRGKATKDSISLKFESGNLETLKKMVDQSSGFTLLPLLAANEVSGERRKQLKDFQTPVPTREVSLVHSRIYKKLAVVDALIDAIRKALPPELLKLREGRFHRVDMPDVS